MGQAAAAAGNLTLQKAGQGQEGCVGYIIRLEASQSGHQGSGKAPCPHTGPAPAGPCLRPQHSL